MVFLYSLDSAYVAWGHLLSERSAVRICPGVPRRSKRYDVCSDLFYQSERTHFVAPPFQTGPASLGSGLGPPCGRLFHFIPKFTARILLLLASEPDPLSLGSDLVLPYGRLFFVSVLNIDFAHPLHVGAHLFCCSPSPNYNRCAGA